MAWQSSASLYGGIMNVATSSLLSEGRTRTKPYSGAYTYYTDNQRKTAVAIVNGVAVHNGAYTDDGASRLVQVIPLKIISRGATITVDRHLSKKQLVIYIRSQTDAGINLASLLESTTSDVHAERHL